MKVIRVILFVINLIAAVGLLLTTMAGGVAPSGSIVPSLLAFGYVPMLAANVVFVVLWLLMRRWTFVLSVAAIAVRCSFVGLYVQVGGTRHVPDAAQHPGMVTLMTYNVRQFNGREFDHSRADSNAMRFLRLVADEGPDVLCLQEYAATPRLNVTDSLVLRGYNHYYGTHTASSGAPYGSVVFSRLPISYVKRIDADKLLVELLCSDGGHVRVVCVHAESFRFDDADREEIERMRRGEVDEGWRRTLAKVKQTIRQHEHEWTTRLGPVVSEGKVPVVVAGDLNEVPSSWLYARLSERLDDAWRECGSGLGITYDASFPPVRIDNVFHSHELRALCYRRVRTDISDHYPVVVALERVEK